MRMPDKGVAGISKSRKEEKIQLKPLTATMTPLLQRQSEPEDKTEEDEEEIQAKPLATQITPLVQRQAASEEEMEEEEIQAKAAPGGSRTVTPLMAANINALRGGGQPLPETTRSFFEARFGVDFGQVRVHTGPRAMETARGVSARAYTIGRDIVFGSGQYALESVPGKKLLAHELTHTLQQKAAEKLPNSAGTFIQRSEKETKQLCPRYWKYNTKKKFKDYNCAGLSHRTYVYIDPIKDLPKMLPQSSARSKCKAGEVKHWVWLYWFHLENHKGKVIQKPLLGVHTVAGVVGKTGNDPTDVYSKNGVRPVEGPGT